MIRRTISKIYQAGLRKKFAKRLSKLKNCHLHQRCFVIGNGPSLTIEDLDKLGGEYSFACNNIFKLYDRTIWRPTYYASQDDAVIIDNQTMLSLASKECEICFLNGALYRNYPKELRRSKKVSFFRSITEIDKKGLPPVSEDITKGINNGYTITFAMIQIAMYMGFKEIYLLGIDHNFSIIKDKEGNVITQNVKDHFEGGDHLGIKKVEMEVWKLDQTFLSAREYAKKHNVKIYNATRGGKLEVFERVDLDQVLGEE